MRKNTSKRPKRDHKAEYQRRLDRVAKKSPVSLAVDLASQAFRNGYLQAITDIYNRVKTHGGTWSSAVDYIKEKALVVWKESEVRIQCTDNDNRY